MQVGVLSDTHIHVWPQDLLAEVNNLFRNVELVLHAGDIVHVSILEALHKPVVAVAGNSDGAMVQASQPLSRIIRLAGYRIGLIHGYGPAEGLAERVFDFFAAQNVDAIVFGHSHIPMAEYNNGIFMFNPGSLTSSRSEFNSLGILQLNGHIDGKIIRLD